MTSDAFGMRTFLPVGIEEGGKAGREGRKGGRERREGGREGRTREVDDDAQYEREEERTRETDLKLNFT